MRRLPPVRAIAIDVLGTLVDEPAALRSTIGRMVPEASDEVIEAYRKRWEGFVAAEQIRIARGERAYADADALDAEAAADLVRRAGAGSVGAQVRVADISPWPDAVAGVEMLARRHPLFALSNATGRTLDALARRVGFRWTRALSAAEVLAYKPAAAVYRMASDAAGIAPGDVLMIAAHAWDLRAAQAAGMRTAYVSRPVGDPPRDEDAFDGEFTSLAEVGDALTCS